MSGGGALFWKLIDERKSPGADVAAIDRRIWDAFGEQRAVLFTDLAGFSRGVAEFGILHFLQIIREQRRLFEPIIHEHGGIVLKEEADSLLVIFRTASQALDSALALQDTCRAVNVDRAPEDQILLCAGIGFGDVLLVGDVDVWGREVNAASKLGEDTAKAEEILITAAARAAIGSAHGVDFQPIDEAEASFRVVLRPQ